MHIPMHVRKRVNEADLMRLQALTIVYKLVFNCRLSGFSLLKYRACRTTLKGAVAIASDAGKCHL